MNMEYEYWLTTPVKCTHYITRRIAWKMFHSHDCGTVLQYRTEKVIAMRKQLSIELRNRRANGTMPKLPNKWPWNIRHKARNQERTNAN